MDSQTTDKANDLLQNGILIATNKGLVCVSLNDALSSDLNLSVEDLKTVAQELILQEEVNKGTPRKHSLCFATPLSSDATIDSDDPTSDCSGIALAFGAAVQGSCTPRIVEKVTDLPLHTLGSDLSIVLGDAGPSISDSDGSSTLTNTCSDTTSDSFNIKILNVTAANATGEDVSKLPPKRRGGWPKGRKRKPELLHLPPKAPATGYNLYLNDMRKQFKNSTLAFHEITKIIGNKWSSLSLEQKQPYLERAEGDKRRYRDELRIYRQSGAYQLYLAKKRRKKMQNNVLSESDMDATDDIDDEDNEELYCRTCDQWFHNLHNKREHLQGRQHVQAVVGDMRSELGSDSPSHNFLDESSINDQPICVGNIANDASQEGLGVTESIAKLISVVTRREKEIKTLRVRVEEAEAAHEALYQQLCSLNERESTLKSDLEALKDVEKNIEENLFQLWKLPSLFVTTDLNSLYLESSEYLTE